MTYHKEGPACGKIPCDPTSSEADCEYPLDPESSKSPASIAQSNKQREVLGVFIGQFQKPAKSGTGKVLGKGGFYGTHTARHQTDRHIHTAASSDADYAPGRECTGSDED